MFRCKSYIFRLTSCTLFLNETSTIDTGDNNILEYYKLKIDILRLTSCTLFLIETSTIDTGDNYILEYYKLQIDNLKHRGGGAVGAFASHAEGWMFQSQLRPT